MIMDELAEHEVVYSAIKSSEKRTNFERIKNMSVEEMARRNIKTRFDPYFICITSDGKIFKLSEKQLAIQHEITWLNSEIEVKE